MNRAALWGCVCVLLVAGVTAPVVATTDTSGAASTPAPSAAFVPANNSTTQHEHPSSAAGEGSTADIRRWLSGRMAGVLAESTIQLSQGQYEAADRLLGEEYESYFGKYVDVAGETNEQDTTRGRVLAEAKAEQQRYVSLVQRYQQTYEQYQAARANGNETRARRLARRLQRISQQLSNTSQSLTTTLSRVGNLTNTNLSQSIDRIHSITRNVSQQQQTVINSTFVRTSLSARVSAETASYTDPVSIRGRLTPLGNASLPETVTIAVNGRPRRVALGSNGSFQVPYRPTTIPTGRQSIRVAYNPENASVFLGSSTTVTATIEPVTPDIRVQRVGGEYRYGESIRVTGRVVVNGTAVTDVPVSVRVGDTSVGRVTTNANGTFTVTSTVPAGLAAGTHDLQVAVAQRGRAVAYANASTPVAIARSATDLSVRASEQADDATLAGRLRTADGTPVRGQQVTVLRNGTRVATATTNATGHFAVTVSRPPETASFRVVFNGSGTNLASASTSVRVTGIPAQAGGLPLLLVLGGLLAVGFVATAGGYAYWRRTTDSTSTPTPGPPESAADASPNATSQAVEYETMFDRIAAGDPSQEGVVELYGLVRRALASELDTAHGAQTHWEFYQSASTELENAAVLRELTEQYERAAYADAAVSADAWADAVAAAEAVLDRVVFSGEDTTGE